MSAGSDTSGKQHTVHGVIGASPTPVSRTTSASSASHETRCKSENASNTDQSGDMLGNWDHCRLKSENASNKDQSGDVLGNWDHRRLKSENQAGNLCDLSKEKDYPFLLGALKAEKEQVQV